MLRCCTYIVLENLRKYKKQDINTIFPDIRRYTSSNQLTRYAWDHSSIDTSVSLS